MVAAGNHHITLNKHCITLDQPAVPLGNPSIELSPDGLVILQRYLKLHDALLAMGERGGEIGVASLQKFVFDSNEIDMSRAANDRRAFVADGREAPGVNVGRVRAALHPFGLMTKSEVEVDDLCRKFMLV